MPNYQIIITGRMGRLVASCLPDLRPVSQSATVLHALVSSNDALLAILATLSDRNLIVTNVRITKAPTARNPRTGADLTGAVGRTRAHPGRPR